MKKIVVMLYGCHDNTSFEIEATDDQIKFLKELSKKSENASNDRCMPTMNIKE